MRTSLEHHGRSALAVALRAASASPPQSWPVRWPDSQAHRCATLWCVRPVIAGTLCETCADRAAREHRRSR